jgi:hypothetical protein
MIDYQKRARRRRAFIKVCVLLASMNPELLVLFDATAVEDPVVVTMRPELPV